MTKLKFEWDGEQYIAWHNGYRIRAENDNSPENPLENWDGNWPCLVRYDGRVTAYDKVKGASVDSPLHRFTDEQLVHDQIAIAKILDTTIRNISIDSDYPEDAEEPVNYIHDADVLRDAFERQLSEYIEDRSKFDVWAALYDLLGIPALSYYSRGHCQGDYAELLIVATPEACAEFGTASTRAGGFGPYAHVDAYWEKNLQGTGDLYGAWAWGDVYGYIVEFDANAGKPAACNMCDNTLNDGSDICDQCGGDFEDPEPEWEEVPDGSCWGFYGDDFDESGLAEAALDAVPDEPAPAAPQPSDTTETVGSSDNLLECAA